MVFSYFFIAGINNCGDSPGVRWARENAAEPMMIAIGVGTLNMRNKTYICSSLLYSKANQKKRTKNFYHLVRETMKNPAEHISLRGGARNPVMPTKLEVLHNHCICIMQCDRQILVLYEHNSLYLLTKKQFLFSLCKQYLMFENSINGRSCIKEST